MRTSGGWRGGEHGLEVPWLREGHRKHALLWNLICSSNVGVRWGHHREVSPAKNARAPPAPTCTAEHLTAGSPQVLCKRDENIQELVDHVQCKHLLGLVGARLARWLAAPLRRFVAQVGHPQGVQQGDHVGEQPSLHKSESKHGSREAQMGTAESARRR